MTYWNREHEQNLRRIRDMKRELETIADETIPALIADLKDDDFDATLGTCTHLRVARSALNEAFTALDSARELLPEPKYPPRFRQLHPTAQDVMERDG
jgi:hypothetical protein